MKSIVDRKVGTRIAKMLYETQHEHGYLLDQELERISDQTGEPLNVIQDVISFFPHYRRTPPPKCSVHVCRDMSCRLRGAMKVRERFEQWQSTTADTDEIEIHEASCLGRCDRGPAVMINEQLFVARQPQEYVDAAESILQGLAVIADTDRDTAERSLANAEIDCYRGSDLPPYSAVKSYMQNPVPTSVVQSLKTASLLGMGGAGAPASDKWEEARKAAGESKYVVCNADESEPGTFKDRDLLLAAPHLVIEGMIMAGLVIDAKQGFIYVRHEYQEQIAQLEEAIDKAVKMNACGPNIFDSGRSFQLEVFVSPGGYVCGEQTALIEALEGKRSEPRNRPPELQTNGLYDQPTVLNNVETFAWVPSILLKMPTDEQLAIERSEAKTGGTTNTQGVWYKRSGRDRFRGKRFFSISGDLNKPGVYEVPSGITLGELIDDYAGGMKDGMKLQAVALSGPSGGFLPAILPKKAIRENEAHKLVGDAIDVRLLPLDLNVSREIGFMLGGGLVVYGETADMLDQAIACSRFYQRESCGKCVPCRLGSRKLVDMAESLGPQSNGSQDPNLDTNVNSLVRIMETTSICGLGQVAGNPLRSYLRFFLPQRTQVTQ
ncbi:MAG: NAD(P)H-dependent oxidoreductase subunit E [Pirellulaceae bacterium]|nr:NAD(P)H-dependent oxidoreductase subunit E [Pirellulaceae bacterium]